jgi:peptide/nickel transport system substrate-binding protein
VRIKTKEADPIILNKLVSLFMLPPKYSAQAGDDGIAKQGVGTGSFKGVQIVPGQRMQLEAWDGCWRGPSKVKQARVLQFNDEAGMHAGLRTGDIDIIWRVEPDQVDSLKNEANFRVQSYSSATAFSVLQDTRPAMADRRVRQALNMAVNKQEFVDKLMLGRADILQGQMIEKGILGYHDGLKPIPYDPERARALLREAGHPNLQLAMGSSVGIRPIVEGVAGYLQAVGVGAKINVYESAVYTRHGTQGTTDNTHARNWDYFHTRDYDVFGVGMVLQQPQPHFPNPEFKALYQQSRSEVDPEKRAVMIQKMSEILHAEAGVLFLFIRQLVSPHTRKIERIAPSFDTAVYLWQIEKEA